MHKTSVYLTPEEAQSLRLVATRTGRSQAELIREGVRLVTSTRDRESRVFRSMARGRGGGAPYRKWDPDELYRAVAGRGAGAE
jgi:Arc/MetJ-type ribon-helix-helix transcriptional regulator